MQQEDRRIRRTKKSLGEALIALALEKEYDEITIQEITDRADIGYRTFFRHYSDKDELLKDVLSTMMAELRELMAFPPLETFTDSNFKASDLIDISGLFQHVQENSDLYRVLLRSERTFVKPATTLTQRIKAVLNPVVEEDILTEIIANHIIAATFALIRWWLDNDMCYSPEVMGEYAFSLIVKPAHEMILRADLKQTSHPYPSTREK